MKKACQLLALLVLIVTFGLSAFGAHADQLKCTTNDQVDFTTAEVMAELQIPEGVHHASTRNWNSRIIARIIAKMAMVNACDGDEAGD